MLVVVVVLWFGATALADDRGPTRVEPDSTAAQVKKQSELQWARGVADDFLAAWIGGHNAEAEMLLTEDLKKRYERYPQCTPLATRLLDVKYAGLTAGTILTERIAPDEDETRFTGKLTGTRNGKPIESEFSLRVVKESGKWRVTYFSQEWRWAQASGSSGK
jgi:hypothetical protein